MKCSHFASVIIYNVPIYDDIEVFNLIIFRKRKKSQNNSSNREIMNQFKKF